MASKVNSLATSALDVSLTLLLAVDSLVVTFVRSGSGRVLAAEIRKEKSMSLAKSFSKESLDSVASVPHHLFCLSGRLKAAKFRKNRCLVPLL